MSVVSRFAPLADRVLVQKIVQKASTAGGVILPEQAKQTINAATVIAVGPGRQTKEGINVSPSVAVGDTVVVPEFGGMSLKFDDSDYLVFRNEDIVGVVVSE